MDYTEASQRQRQVIDRMLFASVAIAPEKRLAFMQRMAEEVVGSLRAKGYTDTQILVARIQFTKMVQERLTELQAITPDQWGNA